MNAAESLLSVGLDSAIALECGDIQFSYGDLRRAVCRAAGAWQYLGLKAEDRVVVFAADGIDWVVTYLGVIWAGGVAIGVNPRLGMADLGAILTDAEVQFVWTDTSAVQPIITLAGGLDTPPQIVVAKDVSGCINWNSALATSTGTAPVPRDAEQPSLWIGTSGTTGTPKGVIHPQRVVDNAHCFAQGHMGVTAQDRLYATSKFFFAYALGNSLLAGLRLGATVIIDPEWPTPDRVLEMVAKHKPTIMFSVPTLYSKIVQAGYAPRLADCGIRHFVSAGEAMPAMVCSAWQEATGQFPISGYGTSETLCLMLYSTDNTGRMHPTPNTEVQYATDLAPSAPQRIWVRAPTVALGYWRRPEAEADSFRDGWFSPGDMFLRQDGDTLEFAGRSDDLLKISGQWVSTQWIEQALVNACGDAIQQLAAVGATTPEGLTAIAILAVSAIGRETDARQRLATGIEALPKHRRPRWVHWVNDLPMTATGKMQRGRLRAIHDDQLAQTGIVLA